MLFFRPILSNRFFYQIPMILSTEDPGSSVNIQLPTAGDDLCSAIGIRGDEKRSSNWFKYKKFICRQKFISDLQIRCWWGCQLIPHRKPQDLKLCLGTKGER